MGAQADGACVGYGSIGGARAVEHLRTIGVELQMVPVRNGVHVGGSDFFKVHPMGANGEPMSDIAPVIAGSTKAMLDDVVWWAHATIAARG
jgi:NAD(P)H-dependent FMN reductase